MGSAFFNILIYIEAFRRSREKPKIFISYSSPDSAAAKDLAKNIVISGAKPVFMDVDNLWSNPVEETVRQISGCVGIIALTNIKEATSWIIFEISVAQTLGGAAWMVEAQIPADLCLLINRNAFNFIYWRRRLTRNFDKGRLFDLRALALSGAFNAEAKNRPISKSYIHAAKAFERGGLLFPGSGIRGSTILFILGTIFCGIVLAAMASVSLIVKIVF